MALNKLSETKVRKLEKPGIYSDGGGLYLRVRSGGSKQWFFIYKRDGKRTEIGLGGYGQGTAPVSVELAREKADAIRNRLARGEELAKRHTFADVMEDTIKNKLSTFRNDKHKAQWRMTLDTYAKALHRKPIADITRNDVVEALKPIWTEKPETADRTRMRIAAVIDHAKARGLFTGDNPADWKGGLKELLPARQKLSRGHHDAIDYHHIAAVMARLRTSTGVSARAAEFTCLTSGRSGEVRFMTWGEVDLDGAVWTVPAERMKASKEHRVPLSVRAVEILRAREQVATGDLVFEGGTEGAPVSDTAMMKSLRAASDGKGTLHGFRSSFRDWAGDMTHHPRDVIEAALAHTIGNATEAAYRRKDALEKRRVLMQDWADFCAKDQSKGG
ncbi:MULTISPECIES: site-specific integrase [unclassified Sinorhizobium]|uniref:tyrosine-type recombinase/integrase n=1 Tax=unclassified Sinorhizobium TaxID=2613772 RepID=UPI0024C389A2|nr:MULTISPECIES: site-specific integrase [unclassified Sinorhizobium]MDK1372947.1 integrase arm-type DNA-binding domain-containing protein [Sinorhizobium sp. 6-70]MDK1477497.1 integrase arm-type DNA-binding domain-containing protein [Sinorhizobium sp. 6-117]